MTMTTEPATDDFLEMHICPAAALRRAARRLGQFYDDALAPTGLTGQQALLLSVAKRMTEAGTGPTLQTLAAALQIQISALTHALKPLARDGLIAVVPDPADRRTKRAVVTEPGRRRLDDVIRLWSDANRRVEAALGTEAMARLRALADRIASAEFIDTCRAQGGEPPP
jgi:DNA-binding MarR family transcriptional regulator